MARHNGGVKTALLSCVFALFASASALADHAPPVVTDRVPGVDLAEGVSQITGTAISPLLGVSASGVWRYYRTPAHLRGRLPWFCHPAAWGTGLAILALCFLKDSFGTAAPTILKKPLDMIELFEDKLSALVASAAFIPLIAAEIARHTEPALEARAMFSPEVQYASVLPGLALIDLRLLLVPLAVVTFFVVWVVSHAIHVLIALSPFTFVDAGLKLMKTAVLSTIVGFHFISPFLGAAISLAIIFIAALLAPKAFRLTLFGTMFALDILLPWRARKRATPTEAHVFVASRTVGLPTRTYGRIQRGADGSLQFVYRPLFILPRRRVALPVGTFVVAKGVLYPSLLHHAEPGAPASCVLVFLPRYRSHEQAIADHFAIVEVRDSSLARGFKAMRAWLVEMINAGRAKTVQLQQASISATSSNLA